MTLVFLPVTMNILYIHSIYILQNNFMTLTINCHLKTNTQLPLFFFSFFHYYYFGWMPDILHTSTLHKTKSLAEVGNSAHCQSNGAHKIKHIQTC